MEPLSLTDDRVRFRLTVTADWGGTGGDALWDAFSGVVPDPGKRHVTERKHNSGLYNMKSDGYSEVDVLDGVTWEGVDGPLPEGWIGRSKIALVLDDVDGAEAAYEQLKAWFNDAREGENGLSPLVDLPPLEAFSATKLEVHAEDGLEVIADPSKCEREWRSMCLVDVGRWTLAYDGEERPENSWESGEPANVLFDHSKAYTVVLAAEVADVFGRFLEEERLLVAERPDEREE